MTAIIKGTGIVKRYASLEVLKGIDITINKGEVVSIVGASGAGKTTLLTILGTLALSDRGQLEINSQNIMQLDSGKLSAFRNEHIGLVFQFHHLLPEFTALENMCVCPL